MHLSDSFKKLLGILCVVVLCVSYGEARGSKKTSHSRHSTTAETKSHTGSSRHAAAGRSGHHSSTRTGHVSAGHRGKSQKAAKTVARRPRGQQGIDSDRAREIQSALIREKYLDGEPTGEWDTSTRQALVRFQSDNGWQSKVVPDSRALIKLGLGPKHADLINPESVSDSMPNTAREIRPGGGAPH